MAFNGNYIRKYIFSFVLGTMKIVRKRKNWTRSLWGLNENDVIIYSSLCHFICKIQPFAQQWNQSSLFIWLMMKYSASHGASEIKGHSEISLTHNPLKKLTYLEEKYPKQCRGKKLLHGAKIPLKPVSSFGGQV